MRRLAQFVRLRASRVSRLACVSRLRAFVSRASRVCVHLSRVRLASVCVCSRQGFRMRASRVCICLASVCVSRLRLSRVCVHLSRVRLASACICLACVSRLSASVHVKGSECVRLRLRLSRVCLASVSRRSSCLASVVLSRVCLASVVLSRVCLSPCECLRGLAHFMRRSSFKEFKRFLLSSYYLIMSQCQSIHPIT